MSSEDGLSVIVPFFNEEILLESMIRRQYVVLERLHIPWEMILVNDGSWDRSKSIAEGLVEEFSNLRLVFHEVNRHLGAAIRTGIRCSRHSRITFIPVDNPLSFDTIEAFLKASRDQEIVLGIRPKREGYSTWMSFGSWVLHKMEQLILGLPRLPDYNWLAIFHQSVFDSIDFRENGILYQAEILALAVAHGFRIGAIPCPMAAREAGEPTVSRITTVSRTFLELLRLGWRIRSLTHRSTRKGVLYESDSCRE